MINNKKKGGQRNNIKLKNQFFFPFVLFSLFFWFKDMFRKIPFNFQAYFYFKKPINKRKMFFGCCTWSNLLKIYIKNHIV